MRPSFRSSLLLGSAIVALSSSVAYADDPLLPEGAQRPTMGKELVLPPIINEAPPNTAIVLPPPGQEHLLGQRPMNSVKVEKVEARVADEVLEETKSAEASKPSKKAKRKAASETQTAQATADQSVYTGAQATVVPDQAMVVAEAPASPKIVETNARMADLTKPAMGGPELAGPPNPADGMASGAPIRDGDTIDARQADVLTKTADAAKPAVANAPAMERFEIAQATTAPMPVTPAKSGRSAGRDWDVELSGSIGYGSLDTESQGYFGRTSDLKDTYFNTSNVSEYGGSGSGLGNIVATDGDDEVVTYEVAARINLTGDVEPLGGGSNVEPYLKVAVSGFEADFSTRPSDIIPGRGENIVIPGVSGGEGYDGWDDDWIKPKSLALQGGDEWPIYLDGNYFLADGPITNIVHKGKLQAVRGTLEYGQTWKGNSADITGFFRVAHTRRDIEHTLDFSQGGQGGECGDDCEVVVEAAAIDESPIFLGFGDGRYETDLDVNTTSFGLGAGVSIPLTKDKRLKADVTAHGSYDITTVDGTDALYLKQQIAFGSAKGLDMGGPTFVDTTRISATEESFGYGAGAGISYDVTEKFSLRLGAEFTSQETAPVVIRDGFNPSRVELEREDMIVGTLTAKLKL